MIKTIRDFKDLKGKKVLLRADFNVPLDDYGDILDDTRIREEIPTIKYLIDRGAKVIICSHLGRPKGYDKFLSLFPVATNLMKYFPNKVRFCDKTSVKDVKSWFPRMDEGDILVMENLRFDPREEENDPTFVNELASLADYYVNDAFGTCHRKHASTYGVAVKLPSAIGFLVEKELKIFSKAIERPIHPYVAVFGGAKIADKLAVLESAIKKADTILIGGGMAYTFLLAQGYVVGKSIVSLENIQKARDILKGAHENGVKVVLPVDHIVLKPDGKVVKTKEIESEDVGLDIGPETIKLFETEIAKAKQIIWNGPLGKYEDVRFRKGTLKVAKAIAKSDAYSIVGGGDSVSAVNMCGVASKISYISTGGGASLKLMEGKMLPAIEVIDQVK